MANDKIVSFSNPAFRDELTDLVRSGVQRIIRQVVEEELKSFLDKHGGDRDAEGRRAVVRNGYLPERQVLTGVGPVTVQAPNLMGWSAPLHSNGLEGQNERGYQHNEADHDGY